MIISQLALCEECRDASCARCRAFLRRQRRRARRKALKNPQTPTRTTTP